MMRINLLPLRAARRRDTARQELLTLAGVLVAVLVGLFVLSTMNASEIDDWEQQVRSAKAALAAQKKDLARVQEFKKEAELLEKRLKVIATLKNKRFGPAKMLYTLSSILTDQKKVWLTKLEEKDGRLLLEGGAMEHQDVSDFQIALSQQAPMFKNVKLTLVAAKKTDGIEHLEWKLSLSTDYSAG